MPRRVVTSRRMPPMAIAFTAAGIVMSIEVAMRGGIALSPPGRAPRALRSHRARAPARCGTSGPRVAVASTQAIAITRVIALSLLRVAAAAGIGARPARARPGPMVDQLEKFMPRARILAEHSQHRARDGHRV